MAKRREEENVEKSDRVIPFSEYEWVTVEDNILTIGITEDGVDSVTEIVRAELPAENTVVDADEVCGELETPDGPLHIYCPVKGNVIELNAAVIENPDLIAEDPYGDGWLLRMEAEDPEELNTFIASQDKKALSSDDDDDDDDDDNDFEEYDEDEGDD